MCGHLRRFGFLGCRSTMKICAHFSRIEGLRWWPSPFKVCPHRIVSFFGMPRVYYPSLWRTQLHLRQPLGELAAYGQKWGAKKGTRVAGRPPNHPPTAPPKGTTTLFMPVATFYKVYFACRHHQQPSESSSSSSVLTILGWHLDGGFSRMPQGVQESLKYVRHIRPAGNYLWCRKTGGENYLRWVANFLATFWNQLT